MIQVQPQQKKENPSIADRILPWIKAADGLLGMAKIPEGEGVEWEPMSDAIRRRVKTFSPGVSSFDPNRVA